MRPRLLIPLALLFASGCHKQPTSGVEIDSSFTRYIAPSTKALIGVNVDQLKATDFYKRHANQFKLPQMADGLDPARDVSVIVAAWDGKQILTMARGTFKPSQQQNQFVVFLPKGMALAGPPDLIKKSMAETGSVPEELQARLHGVLPHAQIWGASIGILPLANIPLKSGMQSALSNFSDYVNGTTLGIAFDSGVHLKVNISCISAEGAQRVNDALRGVIGFARLSTKDNELEMLRLWDAIKVDKTERGVEVHADLPADLADKFMDRIPGTLKR